MLSVGEGLGESSRRCKALNRHLIFFLSFSFGAHCKPPLPHLEPIVIFNFISSGCFCFQLRLSLKLSLLRSLQSPGHRNWTIVSSRRESMPYLYIVQLGTCLIFANIYGLFYFQYQSQVLTEQNIILRLLLSRSINQGNSPCIHYLRKRKLLDESFVQKWKMR